MNMMYWIINWKSFEQLITFCKKHGSQYKLTYIYLINLHIIVVSYNLYYNGRAIKKPVSVHDVLTDITIKVLGMYTIFYFVYTNSKSIINQLEM